MQGFDHGPIDPLTRATSALAAGDIDTALAVYQRGLAGDEIDGVIGRLGLAVCHARRREWPAAEAILHAALALDGGCATAWAYLGAVRFERGEITAALDDLDVALALAPADPIVRLKRGEIFLRLGRLHDAASECQQAAALADADPATRDYARALVLGVRRELAGSFSRTTPSPGNGFARLRRGVLARFAGSVRPAPGESALDGSL